MLESLHIQNYALIESLTVDFSEGLNILTGETGAGKSILIGALSFAMGGRAATDAMRDPSQKTVVEATFSVEGESAALSELRKLGIDAENGQVIIRRELLPSLKSGYRANGSAVTSPSLRKIASSLIDIYGQNDSQALLDPKSRLAFLDGYASEALKEVKQGLESAYASMAKTAKELAQAQERLASSQEERIRAEQALSEIAPLKLSAGEEGVLEARMRTLANSQKLRDSARKASSLLYASEASAQNYLSRALEAIGSALEFDPSLKAASSLLETAEIEIEEASLALRECLSGLEGDPTPEMEAIQSRLSKIRSLKKKYAEDIEGILAYQEQCRERLRDSGSLAEKAKEAEKEAARAIAEYKKLSQQASAIRKEAALRLSSEIAKTLSELAMEKAQFSVEFSQLSQPARDGEDEISFLFSANLGMEPKPLAKVASGGELSRVMLAIKNVFAEAEDSGCLIFDEIDTGISGRAAQLVAEKMARLASRRQILSITHLTQIASMADCHFAIQKVTESESTISTVSRLSAEGRAEELARMSSGAKVT
ncbi:MAG: DNA repair protein RecN, partial [Eubacteriaceae bacterium]|nr:DNA repair protein RecN [Eubacteriaceae bacterium]